MENLLCDRCRSSDIHGNKPCILDKGHFGAHHDEDEKYWRSVDCVDAPEPSINKRPPISREAWDTAISKIDSKLNYAIQCKGSHSLLSIHEILGVVDEEKYELLKAVHENNRSAVANELYDMIIACLLGIASIQEDTIDW